MSKVSAKSFDQGLQFDIMDNDDFENDDLVEFQHFYYSQLTKYSKHIRDSYLFSEVTNRFPQEIRDFQEECQLLPESVDYFFQLLNKSFNIEEDLILTYIQCIDLLKISKHLQVRKLFFNINQYIKSRNIDVDFAIQMVEYEIKTRKEMNNYDIEISNEVESLLIDKINKCFTNEKFKNLPIQIIYRVIKQCSPDSIDSDKLFDVIVSSLSKFCVLFPFLDLQKLSEDRLDDLCRMYSKSNEDTQHYYDYLKCNLNLINEINDRKKNLEKMSAEQQNKLQGQLDEQQDKVKDLESKIELLQSRFNESEKANCKLQSQLDDSKEKNDEQQEKMKDLESKIELLQNQVNDSNNVNSEQLNKMKDLENLITQLQNKLENQEKEHEKISLFEGQIVASVEKGILINAEINLKTRGGTLDTSKSKVIVSTSDAKCLGCEAYEKGEPITSLHMKTAFACGTGTYYVRCIAFNSDGESNEIVSNPVTTTLSSLTFEYDEQKKPAIISLPRGQYKLEVWGAKGGDSTGDGISDGGKRGRGQTAKGGLGGYSRGILSLSKNETVYVYVGEEGKPSNSPDGLSTNGGFPDGGGTRTGHYESYTTVPGTGGGSTSIRIGSDTDYNRVIVAGGGGGASGSCSWADPGGFGGGLNGGNCSNENSLRDQGAGTQTGSTEGLGNGQNGDKGLFGKGATGKYKQGVDSGGGGGGGWYGGGSGGYGANTLASSGGGGSGWTFTKSSMEVWEKGDPSKASNFALDGQYYLKDAACIAGDQEFPRKDGNGNERGHSGNGFAKITPL
ncbi:hypothetical protein M9Y10_043739 [Tritrichomonas musculus]|uniref:receptor protein-tyrosine kinase n=1 Tax=Tritrichomonas musculus TaxID=1915356 RepID=A0ABR2K160_9EUKA